MCLLGMLLVIRQLLHQQERHLVANFLFLNNAIVQLMLSLLLCPCALVLTIIQAISALGLWGISPSLIGFHPSRDGP